MNFTFLIVILSLAIRMPKCFTKPHPLPITELLNHKAKDIVIDDLGTYFWWKMQTLVHHNFVFSSTLTKSEAKHLQIDFDEYHRKKLELDEYLEIYAKQIADLHLNPEDPSHDNAIIAAQQQVFINLISLQNASNRVTGMLSQKKYKEVLNILGILREKDIKLLPDSALTTMNIPKEAMENLTQEEKKLKQFGESKYYDNRHIWIMARYAFYGRFYKNNGENSSYSRLNDYFQQAFTDLATYLKSIQTYDYSLTDTELFEGQRLYTDFGKMMNGPGPLLDIVYAIDCVYKTAADPKGYSGDKAKDAEVSSQLKKIFSEEDIKTVRVNLRYLFKEEQHNENMEILDSLAGSGGGTALMFV